MSEHSGPGAPPVTTTSGNVNPGLVAAQASQDPMVFMGNGKTLVSGYDPSRDALDPTKTDYSSAPRYLSRDEASLDWYSWEEEERQKFTKDLYEKGMLQSPNDTDGAFSLWNWAVQQAAGYASVGKDVTPWQVIDTKATYVQADKGFNVKGPHTSTQEQTNIIDDGDAEQIVKSLFRQEFGQDPTDKQVKKYVAQIVSASAKQPGVSTSTTEYDSTGQATNTSTRYQPGFTQADAQGMMEDKLGQDPEAGAYQAVSQYAPLLDSLF